MFAVNIGNTNGLCAITYGHEAGQLLWTNRKLVKSVVIGRMLSAASTGMAESLGDLNPS
jgi:hypothetical protein